MRTSALIAVALVLALAGCGSDSSDDTGASTSDTTSAAGARPVSPDVEPAENQQAIVDSFSGCATDAGYVVAPGPSVPGGLSATVAKSGAEDTTLATFIVFPDGTAAALGATRDQASVEKTGGGLIRKGLTELAAYSAADLDALKPCL